MCAIPCTIQETDDTYKLQLLYSQTSMVHVFMRENSKMKISFKVWLKMSVCTILNMCWSKYRPNGSAFKKIETNHLTWFAKKDDKCWILLNQNDLTIWFYQKSLIKTNNYLDFLVNVKYRRCQLKMILKWPLLKIIWVLKSFLMHNQNESADLIQPYSDTEFLNKCQIFFRNFFQTNQFT